MPLYEYRCQDCGDEREVLQRFADEPLTTCGKCGGQLKKLLSAPAVQFKGTGWYVTDYSGKGKSGKEGASGESKADSSGGGSDSGSGEAKSSESKSDKGSGTKDSGSPAKSTSSGDKKSA